MNKAALAYVNTFLLLDRPPTSIEAFHLKLERLPSYAGVVQVKGLKVFKHIVSQRRAFDLTAALWLVVAGIADVIRADANQCELVPLEGDVCFPYRVRSAPAQLLRLFLPGTNKEEWVFPAKSKHLRLRALTFQHGQSFSGKPLAELSLVLQHTHRPVLVVVQIDTFGSVHVSELHSMASSESLNDEALGLLPRRPDIFWVTSRVRPDSTFGAAVGIPETSFYDELATALPDLGKYLSSIA